MTDKQRFSYKVIVWCILLTILTFIIGFLTGEIRIVHP